MKRMIVVATVLGLGVFTAFAQRGGGRAMGRAGAGTPPAGATQAMQQGKAHQQGMPAGAQHQMAHQPGVNLTPAMTARLTPMLPAGVPIETAAEGFKNRGQFIAALHVSQNLGIPFDQLKAQMTGPEAVSLGKAIQTLKPALPEDQVGVAVKTAERQSRDDERAKPSPTGTKPPTGTQPTTGTQPGATGTTTSK